MGLSNVFVLFFECVHELVKHLVPLVSSERRHSFATYKLQFTNMTDLLYLLKNQYFCNIYTSGLLLSLHRVSDRIQQDLYCRV